MRSGHAVTKAISIAIESSVFVVNVKYSMDEIIKILCESGVVTVHELAGSRAVYKCIHASPNWSSNGKRASHGKYWRHTGMPSVKKSQPTDGAALAEAAKPLIKYLNENHHPHVIAIVTSGSVELLEGVLTYSTSPATNQVGLRPSP